MKRNWSQICLCIGHMGELWKTAEGTLHQMGSGSYHGNGHYWGIHYAGLLYCTYTSAFDIVHLLPLVNVPAPAHVVDECILHGEAWQVGDAAFCQITSDGCYCYYYCCWRIPYISVCNWQNAAESDSDDDDIYSDVYEVLSNNHNKVLLMPDNHQQTSDNHHAQASSTVSQVERRPKETMATSSRSRMSIIFGDQCNIQRPCVTSSRRRQTVKKYSIDDFNFVKVLGKGSFGKVHNVM